MAIAIFLANCGSTGKIIFLGRSGNGTGDVWRIFWQNFWSQICHRCHVNFTRRNRNRIRIHISNFYFYRLFIWWHVYFGLLLQFPAKMIKNWLLTCHEIFFDFFLLFLTKTTENRLLARTSFLFQLKNFNFSLRNFFFQFCDNFIPTFRFIRVQNLVLIVGNALSQRNVVS